MARKAIENVSPKHFNIYLQEIRNSDQIAGSSGLQNNIINISNNTNNNSMACYNSLTPLVMDRDNGLELETLDDEEIANESDEDNEFLENNQDDDDEDEDEDEDVFNNANDDENYDVSQEEGNQCLYNNARITVGQSMVLLQQIYVRHNLTKECLEDLMELIKLHCSSANFQKNNLDKFLNYFNIKSGRFAKHFYCINCVKELKRQQSICATCKAPRSAYFIQLPFISHLKEMFKRRDFHQNLQHRFLRPLGNDITDIYDGALYKKLFANNGFLSQPNNISFTWYVDTFPVSPLSKLTATAMYLTINELPVEKRKLRENMLLVSVWYGDVKAQINLFSNKLKEEFEKIAKGITVKLANQEFITVRGILLAGICDLPTRYDVLNFTNFDGRFGCFVCLAEGMFVNVGPTQLIHVYPYVSQGFIYRTTELSLLFAGDAEPDKPVYGVKGHTTLSKLMPDFIKGMGISGIDAEVVKKIFNLWFDSSCSNYPFSLCNRINEINQRLLQIKPSKLVKRMPRSVESLRRCKASELKTFFFHYSLPVFEGILKSEYYQHFTLLIMASKILNGNSISSRSLEVADDLLKKFVRDFENLYTLCFSSIKIHLLLHVPECVKNLGPLWVHNYYQHQDFSERIVKPIPDSGQLDTQINNSLTQIIRMPRLIDEMEDGHVKEYCLNKNKQVRIIEQIHHNINSVGKYRSLEDLNKASRAIVLQFLRSNNLNENNSKISIYFRLLKDNKLYVSKMYASNVQTDSSAVIYRNELNQTSLGLINFFLKINDQHFAVVNYLHLLHTYIARSDLYQCSFDGYTYKCQTIDKLIQVPVSQIQNLCFYININNLEYVSIPINHSELN